MKFTAVLLFLFIVGCVPVNQQLPDFPFAKGNQWTYAATIQYHDDNLDTMITKQTNWLMEVVNVIPHGKANAVILKGFPTDLVWYEGTAERGNYLLLVDSNQIYLSNLPPDDSLNNRVKDVKDDLKDIKTVYNLLFDLPLVKGKTWGADPEMPKRQDSMYAWVVQNSASKEQAGAIQYMTNPDHSIFHFQPGIGITGYQFEHHGTVMKLDMKLISQKIQ